MSPFTSHSCRRSAAFSLIELLTVIGIIAILASISVALTGAAKNARINSRGKTELQSLQTAIDSYHAEKNAFPPDHRLPEGSPTRVNPLIHPLYYELRGMELVNGVFRCRGTEDTITPAAIQDAFGRRGFLNASADPNEPARTYFEPKASAVGEVTVGTVRVKVLASPFPWSKSAPEAAPIPGSQVNPWRYVSTSPTNNPGSYDLWTEVYVGKEKRVFKNW